MVLAVPAAIVCGIASAAFGANLLAAHNAFQVGRFALPANFSDFMTPFDLLPMGVVVTVICLISSRPLRKYRQEHWWAYGLIGLLTACAILIAGGGANRPLEMLLAAGFGGMTCWFVCRRMFIPGLKNHWVTIGGVVCLLLLPLSGVWLLNQVDADERAPLTAEGLAPIRAVATAHALWLMMDQDTLVEYDRVTQQHRRLDQKDLRALATGGDTVWALSEHMEPRSPRLPQESDISFPGTIELRAYGSHGEQASSIRHHDAGDMPLALTLVEGRPLILTQRSILRFASNGQWRVTALQRPTTVRSGDTSLAMATGDAGHLYGGIDGGEFGGGAFRIDLTNGQYEPIERRDSAALCAGPLNAACSPVTGLAPDPARADCVLASTGLEHMAGIDGAILRLCGHKVEVVSQAPLAPTLSLLARAGNGETGFGHTDAIYGLTEDTKGTVWAMGSHILYRIDRNGLSRITPPRLERHGDLHSATLPGLILIAGPRARNDLPTGQNVLLVPVQD
jgi:hypothetical protein